MKIFNIENNREVLYIQQKNIKALLKYEDELPEDIFDLAKTIDLAKKEDEKFVRVTNGRIIYFIKKTKWIPDFRDLRDKTIEELVQIIEKQKTKLQNAGFYYSPTPNGQHRDDCIHIDDFAKARHSIKDLTAYLCSRQGTNRLPITIPLAIDSEAHIINTTNNLRIGASLEANSLLIESQNGEPCTSKDPNAFRDEILLLANEANLLPKTPQEFKITITENFFRGCFVVKCYYEQDNADVLQEENTTQNNQSTKENPQKKKTLFKRMFRQK